LKITFMERVFTNGLMEEFMKVIGKIIKCTAMVCLHGQMERNIWESMLKIKSMDVVYSNGLMARNMMVNGEMESKMVKVIILQRMESHNMQNGEMENVLDN